jgi:isopentenyl-diphosphate delta-isomerase
MNRPGPGTLIDRVNREDAPIGVVTRSEALDVGANFRTAHVFVFDNAGRLLLQRLAPTRERHPGRWGSSVAAYLFSGETYQAAVERRMADELRLRGHPTYLGKIPMQDEASTKFVALFTFVSDEAEIGEPDQIQELKFWSLPELHDEIAEQPKFFTPTFLELFSFFERGARA